MPCFYPQGDPGDWCQRHAVESHHEHVQSTEVAIDA